ncbi:MAG: 50S ribosomal protein L29 [Armatimonadota bacterium]
MGQNELKEELKSLKEEFFNLRFQIATGHLEDYSKIGQVRKQIARVKTILREKELGRR